MKKTGANVHTETAVTEDRARKGVGSLLRATRLRVGEDVQEVAAALRIRRAYLEAIEDGRFNDLPGVTYAIGFVRTYAEHLGLDGDEVVRRFKAEAQGIGANHELVFPSPVQEGRVPGGAILFIALLLAVGAYGGWYYLSSQGKTIADLVPELPERFSSILDNVNSQPESGDASAPVEPGTVVPAPVPSGAAPETAPEGPVREGAAPAAREIGETTAEAPSASPEPVSPAGDQQPASTPAVAGDNAGAETATGATGQSPGAGDEAPAEPAAEQSAPATLAETAPAAESPEPAAEPRNTESPSAGIAVDTTRQNAEAEPAPAPAPVSPEPVAAAPSPAAQADGLPAPPTVSPPTYGSDADDVRIVLLAVQDSWVQIREADGNLVGAQLLRAGERFRVPNRDGLLLLTGNAGGLELLVDGQKAPSLGPEGAIRRNVPLDPASLLAGTAVSQ